MAKEQAPAFQFYVKDFLSDENTAVMTARQVGAYLLLMLYVWQEQRVVYENAHLARLARVSDDEWDMDSRTILRCFVSEECEGVTYLRHKRLDEERQKQAEWREKSSKGGKSRRKTRRPPTTIQPPLNHPSTTVEPKGNTASASSSASAERKTYTRVDDLPCFDGEAPTDADWLVESYPRWHSEERNGAALVIVEVWDAKTAARAIMKAFGGDRARVEKVGRVFLSSANKKLDWCPQRTIKQFAHEASAVDAWLRESA